MKALRLDGTKQDALRLARCCLNSRTEDDFELVGIDRCAQLFSFIVVSTISEAIQPLQLSEIILPIDTLVFDPFAAMREDIIAICGVFPKTHGITASKKEGGKWWFCLGKWQHKGYDFVRENVGISLDIEAACRLDGVEVVEI